MDNKKKLIKMKSIGRECKRVREENNVSQRELASKIGVCQSLISYFERGEADSAYILLHYIMFFGFEEIFKSGGIGL